MSFINVYTGCGKKSTKIPTDGLRHTVGPSRLVKLANIFFFLRASCDRAVYAVICCRRVSVCVRHNSQVGRGVETGETGSATAPPTFGGAGAVLHRKFVDVTDWRWWLFTYGSRQHSFVSLCTKLTKLADFYDATSVVLVSLLLNWIRWFVILISWAHRA